MRPLLTDVTWQWLRLSDEYAPLLRVAELRNVHASLFRPISYAAPDDLLRWRFESVFEEFDVSLSDYIGCALRIGAKSSAATTDRLAFTWDYKFFDVAVAADKPSIVMRPAPVEESHTPSDKVWTVSVSSVRSAASSGDSSFGRFTAACFSEVPAGSTQAFSFDFLARSASVGADKVTCTFRAGIRDSAAGADRVFGRVTALIKDSVVASSLFLLGGRSFLDTGSSGFSSDAFYSRLVARAPDSAATSDSIVIGVRYPIEFYFGGLAIGGSPFGGRL